MPHLHEKEQFNLLPAYDARCKWSQDDKDRVKYLFETGMSQRAIARETGISRRYISFILFPERLEHAKALFKERRKDGRYYKKETHRKAINATRLKKKLIKGQ